jgi:glycosyltransferase involved in cell wall biosynthesis
LKESSHILETNAIMPDDQPLVSVVMCAYNAGPFLQPALDSLLGQTYKNWELIISDDGSTDGTRERLKELEGHSQVRLFFQDENLGYVANKNFVHRQARGAYITQLDNDDVYATDKLEKQLAIIKQNPELKIVGCGYHRILEDGTVVETVQPPENGIVKKDYRSYPFWFPALLVHKSVFDYNGYFNEYFAGIYGDDVYWTVKANEAFPIFCIKEPLYSYRVNSSSITNVLNNKRKLIFIAVVQELLRQRQETGTDWLEKNDLTALKAFEDRLLNNNKYMAEQYRIWAAKAVDKRDWQQSKELLILSFRNGSFSKLWFKTALYYIRQRYIRY